MIGRTIQHSHQAAGLRSKFYALAHLVAFIPKIAHCKSNFVFHSLLRKLAFRILKHDAHHVCRPVPLRIIQAFAVNDNFTAPIAAGYKRQYPNDGFTQSGLARAVTAYHAHKIALIDGKRNIFQHKFFSRRVTIAVIFYFNNRFTHVLPLAALLGIRLILPNQQAHRIAGRLNRLVHIAPVHNGACTFSANG